MDTMQKRISPLKLVIWILIVNILLFAELTQALECYVCQNQEDNKNKCAETLKICDLQQEQCLTEIRWGSTPYWGLTGQKQHYISKRCATKNECNEAIADKFHKCDRIWYNDWNCTSCCSGDKCNYFVTLAGHSVNQVNILLMASLCSVSLALYFYYWWKSGKATR